MNNHQYTNLRKNIEALQIFKYGIKNSIVYLGYKEIQRIKDYLQDHNIKLDLENIHQISHLYTHQRTPKKKNKNKEKIIRERGDLPKNELIENLVKQAFSKAENLDHFKQILEQNKTIETQIYARGKQPFYGVIYGKYKRRLTSILPKDWQYILKERNVKFVSLGESYCFHTDERNTVLNEIEQLKEAEKNCSKIHNIANFLHFDR